MSKGGKVAILLVVCGIFLLFLAKVGICNSSLPTQEKVDEAISYARKHGLRTDFVVLMNFSTHSGKPRFWVYDIQNKKVVLKSLCSHGCGKGNTKKKAKLSNKPGSKCSCKGMFAIGKYGKMRSGTGYLSLKGLSSTNSNAQRRGILIHPGIFSSAHPIGFYPHYIPLSKDSEGCFAINRSVFIKLRKIAGEQNKRLLLYAYE